jgi:hypothetical protein
MEENNPRFFAGHMGVDGDDVDAGLAQRLKCLPQFVFSHAKSPSTTEFSSLPANAAQAFTPPLYYQDCEGRPGESHEGRYFPTID